MFNVCKSSLYFLRAIIDNDYYKFDENYIFTYIVAILDSTDGPGGEIQPQPQDEESM